MAKPLQSVYTRLNGSCKRLNGLLIRLKKMHPFSALAKSFKRFAYPFKKICIRLTLKRKRLNGLLIRLKIFATV